MELTADKLFSEIFILMTHCATADLEYLASNECANRFKNVLEGIKQYKSTEAELGIDLITLTKALRSGIHIIDDGCPYNDRVDLIYSSGIPCGFKGKVSDHCVFFKDYGKTWTLTKEELE